MDIWLQDKALLVQLFSFKLIDWLTENIHLYFEVPDCDSHYELLDEFLHQFVANLCFSGDGNTGNCFSSWAMLYCNNRQIFVINCRPVVLLHSQLPFLSYSLFWATETSRSCFGRFSPFPFIFKFSTLGDIETAT